MAFCLMYLIVHLRNKWLNEDDRGREQVIM
ncbi:hypothetical protein TELCIR_15809 [Teladorsagia circumcincta]|uniref:Uncharacterized protein n=1 Tax=Teladorsagia circumcincta TaxID=45464 RepID=A0A2G9TX83_TELCI|nr:hypothetical protein TELCIR_15809 [Teladorsagia circumcincta]